jgi:hypothetical protein
MRILIVCYSYFPALNPRAFRWTALAEEFVDRGHDVHVICNKEIDTKRSDKVNGVIVHRVGANLREALRSCLGRPSPTSATSIGMSASEESQTNKARVYFVRVIKWIYNHSVQKILWPDFACFWYFPALAFAHKLILEKKYDVVVSVSLPFTGHCIGLKLKKRYSIHWVVDIGDPFSFMSETPVNNHRLFDRLNYHSESSILQNSDAVSVTTEATRSEYMQLFPHLKGDKIYIVPPLFIPPTNMGKLTPFFVGPPRTRLVFAGTLYSKIRNPAALLELFNSLLKTSIGSQLELHFFGLINNCEPYFEKYHELLGSKIFLHGLVSRASALRAMMDATVLVNLGNLTAYQLPSKVVEYVMLGKPVLNITKSVADSSQIFFSDFEGICSVTEQAFLEDIDELERVKEFIKNPPHCSQTDIDRLKRIHGLESIVESYLHLFQGGVSSNLLEI